MSKNILALRKNKQKYSITGIQQDISMVKHWTARVIVYITVTF